MESLKWFASTVSQSPQRPLAMPSTLQCLAAADACAEDTKVGIGGWVITTAAVAWFAEMWDISELRQTWPFLTKPAQAYIASFETPCSIRTPAEHIPRFWAQSSPDQRAHRHG